MWFSSSAWVSVDRTTLETHSMPADEFVELFCEKLDLLRPHSFIASQQSTFYKDCKLKLVPGEMLVTADFSENYSFVLQDAAFSRMQHSPGCSIVLHKDSTGIIHRPLSILSFTTLMLASCAI